MSVELTYAGVAALVFALGLLLLPRLEAAALSGWRAYQAYVETCHRKLFRRPTPVRLALTALAAGIVVGTAIGWAGGAPLGVLTGLSTAALAVLHLRHAIAARTDRLERQLVPALRSIASSIRAGLVLPRALEVVCTNLPPPIREEVELVLKEHRMGRTLEAALEGMGQRLGSEDLYVVLSTLQLAHRSGGEAGALFEETATALEEIRQLEAKIRAATAQARFQGWGLGLLVPLFMVLLHLTAPQLLAVLFTHSTGHLVLGAIFALELVGLLFMRQLLSKEI